MTVAALEAKALLDPGLSPAAYFRRLAAIVDLPGRSRSAPTCGSPPRTAGRRRRCGSSAPTSTASTPPPRTIPS
ncbi:hypothetical protein ACFQ0B_66165 [Nonomuraea thailandensis]